MLWIEFLDIDKTHIFHVMVSEIGFLDVTSKTKLLICKSCR